MDEQEPHLSATDARAGEKSGRARYILGISLAAIILLFVILLFINR